MFFRFANEDDVSCKKQALPSTEKLHCLNASILNDKRVVFTIHGNRFRPVVDIEHRLKIAFIVWTGTHDKYDKMDAKTIRYVKPIKNEKQYEAALKRGYALMQTEVRQYPEAADEPEIPSVLVKH